MVLAIDYFFRSGDFILSTNVYVVAQFMAKEGKEDKLRELLQTLVAPTLQEPGCYQYDLLLNSKDPRSFCFVERWESDEALDKHLGARHVTEPLKEMTDLVEGVPEVQRYTQV